MQAANGYFKEKVGYRKLKNEAQDRPLWRTLFGRGYGPVTTQIMEWLNELGKFVDQDTFMDKSLKLHCIRYI
jgi:hypothetical protein